MEKPLQIFIACHCHTNENIYMNDTSINYLWAQATNSHKTLIKRPHTSALMQDQFS